jgi:hypothetical protein
VAPFQTHYFSENLIVLGIEPGTSGSVARNSNKIFYNFPALAEEKHGYLQSG